MHSRYIPALETYTEDLNIARIEASRDYDNRSMGHHNISDESGGKTFTSAIFAPVQYHIQQPTASRVLTKRDMQYRNMSDNALYNTRNHVLNATDVPSLANNALTRNLAENARSKIINANQASLDKFNTNTYHFNDDASDNISLSETYNPFLPFSNTNKFMNSFSQPLLTDERMQQHTNERTFNYESDRANIAYNLQRSPEIAARNKRQIESDNLMKHTSHYDRWQEYKQQYRDPDNDQAYDVPNELGSEQNVASRYNSRNAPSDQHTAEAFVNSRAGFDETNPNNLNQFIEGEFDPLFNNGLYNQYTAAMQARETYKSRLGSPGEVVQEERFVNKPSYNRIISYVADTVATFFGLKPSTRNNTKPDYSKQDITELFYADTDMLVPVVQDSDYVIDNKPDLHVRTATRYKPYLLTLANNIPEVFPSGNHDQTALSFLSYSPLDRTSLVQTSVILEDAKYKLVQKRVSEANLLNGYSRADTSTEYIYMELPVDKVNATLRERITKNNLDNPRALTSGPLSLTYEDFITFSDFIVNNPEAVRRVKAQDIGRVVRNASFEDHNQRVFMDERVYNNLAQEIRQHQHKLNTGRIAHEQLPEQNSVNQNYVPLPSAQAPNLSAQSYRPVQQNDTPFATTRSQKLQLNKFNT